MTAVRTTHDLPRAALPADADGNLGPHLARAYERHGPIFLREAPWGGEIVYLVGPEANRFVLSSERLKFSHKIGWGRLMGVLELFGDGLLTMDGPEHDRHRRMMNPAFTIAYMDRYLPLMNRIVRDRAREWAGAGEVDVYDEARKITFDVAAEALVGLRTGAEVDRFREIFVGLLTAGAGVTSEEEYQAKVALLKGELHALLLPRIEERRRTPTDDVLGMLVRAREAEGRALSDEQLIAHTNILLVAGHETSTSLSAWLLCLLAQHPAYRERVLAEQAALLAPDANPTLADIRGMTVLENALSEAERLYPPVPEGPRGVLEEFEFGGYRIPAGAFVFYSIAASHLLPSVWTGPERFDPDRFAPPREEHRKRPYALVGFGGGPRICIGVNFARVEIQSMVSHILRRYSLELVPGQDLRQAYGATGRPVEGIRMRVSELPRA